MEISKILGLLVELSSILSCLRCVEVSKGYFLPACKKSYGSFNILTVSGSCYYLNMFSRAFRQLWSLGRTGGLGRDLFHCAHKFRKRNKIGKQDAQGLADALAWVSSVSQALQ